MKVLITGAAGFLCRGLVIPFEQAEGREYQLRLMDVCDFDIDESLGHEKFIGDVSNEDDVNKAIDGVDAVIVGHMASRQAGAYDEITLPMDVNVKGTALIFAAAIKAGIKHVVLISSGAAVSRDAKAKGYFTGDLLIGGTGMYGLTKACQEVIAEHYAIEGELTVAAIRTGYIHDMDSMCDKYGRKATEVNAQYADRRDIGEVARLSLDLEGPRYEVFYAFSTDEASEQFDVAYTHETLNFKPTYTYAGYPRSS